MWRGEVRAADVDGMSDELESSGSDGDVDDERGEGSGHEAAGAGRNLDPGAEARVATAVRLEEAARRRRLERMRMHVGGEGLAAPTGGASVAAERRAA